MANSVLGGVLADDRKREMRSLPHPLAINHATAPVAYKYFTRSDFYNPTVIFNRSMSRGDGGVSKPRQEELKTIKTEDIDVELPDDVGGELPDVPDGEGAKWF